MSVSTIFRTQWAGYAQVHANRLNFAVHLVTVPVFMAGTVAVIWGLCVWSAATSIAGVLAMMAALAAQGWGHRRESVPSAPFSGPVDAIARLLLEQWVTFPSYVLRRVLRAG